MKNRTKTISLLLAVCMMLTLLPAVAFAAGMENSTITAIKYYESGWLEEVTITYTVGSGASAAAPTKMGIQTYEFSGDDLTNYGNYYKGEGSFAGYPHNYSDWSDIPASGPADCGFVDWDTKGVFTRPGYNSDSSKNTHTYTVTFADNKTFDKTKTYYVYAWTDYEAANKVYPDGYICSFKVNNAGQLVTTDLSVNFNANGGEGTMAPQAFDKDTAQNLTPNAFTRADYTFTGWNAKADGSGTSYADGASVTLTDSGLTLFAQWKEKETSAPGTVDPGTSSGIDLWYNGGNSFGSSKSAVPTSVEIEGVPVSFNGNGREFTVGCISPNAKWVTVRWNSTSVTTNFTPDANAACAEITLPKTGDVSVMAFALMAVVAAAGAMGKK